MTERRAKRNYPISHRARVVGLLVALAFVSAACGSSANLDVVITDESTSTTEAALQDSGLPSLAEKGPTPDAADSDSPADKPVDEGAAIEAYLACMKEEGIDTAELEAASPEDGEAMTSTPEFLAANVECEPILEEAFGDFELDPELEAALSDRSAEMAACGREILGVDIPDDVLLLEEDDPRILELESIETTPEQDAALERCAEEILGDLIDGEGNLTAPEEAE